MIDARTINADTDAHRIAEAIRVAGQSSDKRVLLRGAWRVGNEALRHHALIYVGLEAAGVSFHGDDTTIISPGTDGSENYFMFGIFETKEIALHGLRFDGLRIPRINAIVSEGVTDCEAWDVRVEHFGRTGFALQGDWVGGRILSRLNSQENQGHHGMAITGGKHKWTQVHCIANGSGVDLWASHDSTDVEFENCRFSGNYYNALKWGNSEDDRGKHGQLSLRNCVLSNSLLGNGFTNTFQQVKPEVSSQLVGCTIENNHATGVVGHDDFEIVGSTISNNKIGVNAKRIIGCTIEGGEYGILLEGEGAEVSGCHISGARYGLHGLSGTKAVVRRSTIIGNAIRDVFASDLRIEQSKLGFVDAEKGKIVLCDCKVDRTKGKVEIEQ